jgi:hypothetical protein
LVTMSSILLSLQKLEPKILQDLRFLYFPKVQQFLLRIFIFLTFASNYDLRRTQFYFFYLSKLVRYQYMGRRVRPHPSVRIKLSIFEPYFNLKVSIRELLSYDEISLQMICFCFQDSNEDKYSCTRLIKINLSLFVLIVHLSGLNSILVLYEFM